jgi:hypothetical protein
VLERFLGQVDQAEVNAEGPHHMGERFRIQGFDDLLQAAPAGGRIFLVQADVAFAQCFHRLQHAAVLQGAQHVAEQVAEQFYAGAQLGIAGYSGHAFRCNKMKLERPWPR